MYIQRHAENAVKQLSKMFGAVLVTGGRQVGKTTLLKQQFPDYRYVTLDNPLLMTQAIDQPLTFMKDYPPQVFIDEVQKAPQLFSVIKMLVDESKLKGEVLMTGSQQFQMMKNVSESLSGRVGVLSLLPISMREMRGDGYAEPFVPTERYIEQRRVGTDLLDDAWLWDVIARGGMPELVANPEFDAQLYYASYLKTYIERDIRELAQVGDERKFLNFMIAVAARTGQILNKNGIANEIGVSAPTIDKWLSILEASNIIFLLQPYSNNVLNRVVKAPKIYFFDTGLCAYLTRWTSGDVLKNGAMSGAFFETFVISEILKSYYNAGREVSVYYYRDKNKVEIDLIIECDGVLHPIEIKKHADPRRQDISGFRRLDILGERRGAGAEICLASEVMTLEGEDKVIPLSYI